MIRLEEARVLNHLQCPRTVNFDLEGKLHHGRPQYTENDDFNVLLDDDRFQRWNLYKIRL